jgi:hypothetical protein
MVSRTNPVARDGCGEGVAGDDDLAGDDGGVAGEWEALKLQLSREDLSRGIELESLIIGDLAIRHTSTAQQLHKLTLT